MTNQDILRIAMRQSALEQNCAASDFLASENKVVRSRANSSARVYLTLPHSVNLVSYGNNIVATTRHDLMDTVKEYINRYDVHACFETPQLLVFNEALRPYGLCACFMAEYFLPDLELLHALPCPFEVRRLGPEDFSGLYKPEWGNALCAKRRQYDRLCLGAYRDDELVGLAGASADCENMWQIGIDVLPAFRCQGIASALVSQLALALLDEGKVPFYCAAWSNIRSVRTAIKCGFRPAWVELTAKTQEFVAPML